MADRKRELNQNRIVDLEAGAHVMHLDRGLFCISHAPDQTPPGPSGLPGVRISRAPSAPSNSVEICTFEHDGWIGGAYGAALIRINHASAGVLVTTYRDPKEQAISPRLQVTRLASGAGEGNAEIEKLRASGGVGEAKEVPSQQRTQPDESSHDMVDGESAANGQDVQAHVQNKGDCGVSIGQWIGEPGSQAWIEGFAINPVAGLGAEDIEYQAVLGKGWLSPWVEGGHFCGSRGMSLPILGLRVRLRGEAARSYSLSLSASFTDGTRLGPLEEMEEALEAESLAPLEAFCLEIRKLASSVEGEGEKKKTDRRKSKRQSRGH